MGKIDIILLLCVPLLYVVKGEKVFWAEKGIYMVSPNSSLTGGCFNKNDKIHFVEGDFRARQLSETGECISIYNGRNCNGLPLRPPYLDEEEMDWMAIKYEWVYPYSPEYSYHLCSWNRPNPTAESRKPILYSPLNPKNNFDGEMYQFTGLQQCENLPDSFPGNISHVFLHHEEPCLRFYESKNCKGEMLQLKDTTSMHHRYWTLPYPEAKYFSISGCPKVQIEGEVISFKFNPDVKNQLLKGRFDEDKLADRANFINNSSSPVTRYYEGKAMYNGTAFFRNIECLNQMASVRINATTDVDTEVGAVFDWLNISDELKSAYESQTDGLQKTRDYNTSKISGLKEFSVRQMIEIPPCSEYEVRSYLFYKLEELDFELEIQIHANATTDGQHATAKVKEALPPCMEYIRDVTDTGILARTRGQLQAQVGIMAEIRKHPKDIVNCEGNLVCKKYSMCLNKISNAFSIDRI